MEELKQLQKLVESCMGGTHGPIKRIEVTYEWDKIPKSSYVYGNREEYDLKLKPKILIEYES